MTVKGWQQDLMISSLVKEAIYGAAVTPIDNTKFQGITGHSDYNPDWADTVATDKDVVSGYEHGSDAQIIAQGFKVSIAQPNATPNFVNAMMIAALGNDTPTQDGVLAAYRHKVVPVTVGTALPSFNLIGKKGGLQYLHKGCMVDSVTLSGERAKAVSCDAAIIGSGSRDTDATGFVAPPAGESWMLCKNGYIWLETSANKSIDAANTQGTENISSATPRDLKALIRKFQFKWNNALQGTGFGAGAGGEFSSMDYGRRKAELTLELDQVDGTDLGYYLNGTALTLEIEIKGALIVGGGAMYFGMDIIIPKFKLIKAPLPTGGVNDILGLTYACDIEDDGTNPAVIFNGYNSIPAYFA